jgi:hypothetical protein
MAHEAASTIIDKFLALRATMQTLSTDDLLDIAADAGDADEPNDWTRFIADAATSMAFDRGA